MAWAGKLTFARSTSSGPSLCWMVHASASGTTVPTAGKSAPSAVGRKAAWTRWAAGEGVGALCGVRCGPGAAWRGWEESGGQPTSCLALRMAISACAKAWRICSTRPMLRLLSSQPVDPEPVACLARSLHESEAHEFAHALAHAVLVGGPPVGLDGPGSDVDLIYGADPD